MPVLRLLTPLLALTLIACANPQDAAQACGKQGCPVGTYPDEYRSIREGTDVTDGGDPSRGQAGLAYNNVQEGKCRHTCIAMTECPEGTWPVINSECFTCAQIGEDGHSVSADCSGSSEYEDEEPQTDEEDTDDELPIDDDTLPLCGPGNTDKSEQEPNDTLEDANFLGRFTEGGFTVDGWLDGCGDRDDTAPADWFTFELNCVGNGQWQVTDVASDIVVELTGENGDTWELGHGTEYGPVTGLTGQYSMKASCYHGEAMNYDIRMWFE
jgi:hypothetical protein